MYNRGIEIKRLEVNSMNVLSFLKPTHEVILLYSDETLKAALERMTEHRFTSIPVIDRTHTYVGTLTEGDILNFVLKNIDCLNEDEMEKLHVTDIKRHRDYEPISVNATMPLLLSKAKNENFVPVLDQNEKFIGIVTRKKLIEYFFEHNFMVL
jgi:CBS domain-containing protein